MRHEETIGDINAQLKRLDHEGGMHAADAQDGRARIWAVGFEDQPIVVDAASALEVIAKLPNGVALEEGVDGSLWETLCVLEAEGKAKALEYVEKHHG